MRRELLVPKLGLTMSEGTLVEWMLAAGQPFKAGQVLFVIESEKAANEIEAEVDGILTEICAPAGTTLPCGAVIGYWDDRLPGDVSADRPPAPPTGDAATPAAAPAPSPANRAAPPAASASMPAASLAKPRIPVTPLARRLAARQGIDLGEVAGSGPHGRIRARDIQAHVNAAQAAVPTTAGTMQDTRGAATTSATGPADAHGLPGTLSQPSNTQRVVARRLTAAKQQIPHFYLTVEAEMSAVIDLRRRINAAQSRQRLTLNHFVLAAVGQALLAMPQVNQVWTEEGILTLASSDVGMAVDTENGLWAPVLRDVGCLSLGAIAAAASSLIAKAQAGRLSGADMQGGAITVSNAGMHDVTYMASIINPGQAMILGVGAMREVFRPDAEGRPAIRREMGMVLSADHRVLDGVSALKFLKLVVQGLEQPAGLLVT